MSLSPLVLSGVRPLGAQLVGVFERSQSFWLSSKSMLVVPVGSCTRDQNSSRNLPVGLAAVTSPASVNTPKALRSLLFGGIPPSTTVGKAVSSLVPSPKDSSPDPEAVSVLTIAPCCVPEAVEVSSQSIHPALLTTWLASTSISNPLPASVAAVLVHVAVLPMAVPAAKAPTIKTRIARGAPLLTRRRCMSALNHPV